MCMYVSRNMFQSSVIDVINTAWVLLSTSAAAHVYRISPKLAMSRDI